MKISKVLSFALMATGTGITIGAYKKHKEIENQKEELGADISLDDWSELNKQDDETSKIGRLGLAMVGTGTALAIVSFGKDSVEAKKLKEEEEFYAKLDQRYATREEFTALSDHVDEIRDCHNGFVKHQWQLNKQLVDSMDK